MSQFGRPISEEAVIYGSRLAAMEAPTCEINCDSCKTAKRPFLSH